MTGSELIAAAKVAFEGYRKARPYLGRVLEFWRARRARLALKRLLRRGDKPTWRRR